MVAVSICESRISALGEVLPERLSRVLEKYDLTKYNLFTDTDKGFFIASILRPCERPADTPRGRMIQRIPPAN